MWRRRSSGSRRRVTQRPGLQVVQQRDHVGRVQAEPLAERRLRHGAVVAQQGQRDQVPRAHAVDVRERLVGVAAHHLREVGDEGE